MLRESGRMRPCLTSSCLKISFAEWKTLGNLRQNRVHCGTQLFLHEIGDDLGFGRRWWTEVLLESVKHCVKELQCSWKCHYTDTSTEFHSFISSTLPNSHGNCMGVDGEERKWATPGLVWRVVATPWQRARPNNHNI